MFKRKEVYMKNVDQKQNETEKCLKAVKENQITHFKKGRWVVNRPDLFG